MLTLYYTIRARYLSHEEITQFAYHIQRCNNKQISSHINASLSNRYSISLVLSHFELIRIHKRLFAFC